MHSKFKDFAVVIPCYNESSTIAEVLTNMLELKPGLIIVADDCSKDNSRKIVKQFESVKLLKTAKNTGGPGLPLKLGIKYAVKQNFKYIVTVDADNQHSKEDTKKAMEKMLEGNYAMVSGVRAFDKSIPFSKKVSNLLVKLAFVVLYGINVEDPFCGLRVYSRMAVQEIKFEHGFQWLVNVNRIARKYRNISAIVPIEAIYTEYSLKKGLNLKTGLKVFKRMFVLRVKELSASALRFVGVQLELNA